MDNKNQENLQSRREFFKSAAKAALPVLAVSILGANVLTSCEKEEEVKRDYGCNGCSGSCSSSCSGSCDSSCSSACEEDCSGVCRYGCEHSCEGYSMPGYPKYYY